jgi:hypothetical protein
VKGKNKKAVKKKQKTKTTEAKTNPTAQRNQSQARHFGLNQVGLLGLDK